MLSRSLAVCVSLLIYANIVVGLYIPFLSRRATKCNGHPELCDRKYGNVTFLGSHDSFAVSSEEIILSRNQEVSLTKQLDLGVRMLQAQAHKDIFGQLHFCHTSCFLYDGGRVVNYLKTVKSWLDKNPNEVLTLIFTNGDNVDLNNKWKPAFEGSGISSMVYTPPHLPMKKSDWPPLGEMITSGKRVVVFMDQGADTSKIPYILPQFDHVWEPPFSSTDANFPCRIDRITGSLSAGDHMYLLNHNLNRKLISDDLLIPDFQNIDRTNGRDSILADVNGCIPVSQSNAKANFVMLDFVNHGDGMKTVDQLNGF